MKGKKKKGRISKSNMGKGRKGEGWKKFIATFMQEIQENEKGKSREGKVKERLGSGRER